MRFLGIDLGWQSGASGLCCLDGQPPPLQPTTASSSPTLRLISLDCRTALPEILNWVDQFVPETAPGAIAVDAPTLIPNATGMRLPDRLAHHYFGRYHAGCYPANLGRPFAARLVDFGLQLEARGFEHTPEIPPQRPGRYQLEVFPHAAMLHLFRLNRILKYKKGRLADRRPELTKLRQLILDLLPTLTPALAIAPDALPEIPLGGAALKAVEDQLDSVICAYVAAHWWYWGCDTQPDLGVTHNRILGSRTEGYIIVPTPEGYWLPEQGSIAGDCHQLASNSLQIKDCSP